jgi:hypothetical protein
MGLLFKKISDIFIINSKIGGIMVSFWTPVDYRQTIPFFSFMNARRSVDAYLTLCSSKTAVVNDLAHCNDVVLQSRKADPLWVTIAKISSYVLLFPFAFVAKCALRCCHPLHEVLPANSIPNEFAPIAELANLRRSFKINIVQAVNEIDALDTSLEQHNTQPLTPEVLNRVKALGERIRKEVIEPGKLEVDALKESFASSERTVLEQFTKNEQRVRALREDIASKLESLRKQCWQETRSNKSSTTLLYRTGGNYWPVP